MYKCRICHSKAVAKVFMASEMMYGTRKKYEYFQCAKCKTLQIAHPENDTRSLYPKSYYSLNQESVFSGGKRWLKNKILQLIIGHELGYGSSLAGVIADFFPRPDAHALKGIVQKDSAILDVGCGIGYLLEALAGLGFTDLTGCEPFIANEICNEKYSIYKSHLNEMGESKKFDVIMMHHSFEHMENPHEALDCIRNLLTPKGVCIIRVPVSDSEAFEIYGEHWGQLDAPRHCFLYTNESMRILAEAHSLKIEKIADDSTEFQFISSEQYRRNIPLNGENSYYRPIYKRLLSGGAISRSNLRIYKQRAQTLNKLGRGDQRAFYLKHSDAPSSFFAV